MAQKEETSSKSFHTIYLIDGKIHLNDAMLNSLFLEGTNELCVTRAAESAKKFLEKYKNKKIYFPHFKIEFYTYLDVVKACQCSTFQIILDSNKVERLREIRNELGMNQIWFGSNNLQRQNIKLVQ
jgi:nicotinate-nucleotide pyrophosphorylase